MTTKQLELYLKYLINNHSIRFIMDAMLFICGLVLMIMSTKTLITYELVLGMFYFLVSVISQNSLYNRYFSENISCIILDMNRRLEELERKNK